MTDCTLFALLVTNLFAIIGFNRITEYGHDVDRKPMDKEALWFIRWYAVKWMGRTLSKPVCTCIVCMSSLHSLYFFWPLYDFTLFNIYLYAIYALTLSGMAAVYERIFD